LQINHGYVSGEWNFTFAHDNVTIFGPNGFSLMGTILASPTEMDLVVPSGGKTATYYGIFEQDFGPASVFLTWALAPLGATNAGFEWGTAMTTSTYRVWIMEQPKNF